MLAAQGVTMAVDEKRMKEVDGAYGPAEDMAPFLPYRSTEEASFISGAVFTVTGNGRVTLYSDPEPTAEIKKDGAPWSVDKLIETVPLPCSRTYVSSATRNDGDAVRRPGRPGRPAHRRSWNSTRDPARGGANHSVGPPRT